MEEMVTKLMDKVGLDEDKAKQVVDFVKEHIDDIPKWIGQSDLADKIPGADKLKNLF